MMKAQEQSMEQDDTFLDDLAPVFSEQTTRKRRGRNAFSPESQQFYSETIWILTAIGDVYFQKWLYPQAHRCFDQACGNLSGEG